MGSVTHSNATEHVVRPRRVLFVIPRVGPVGAGAEALLFAFASRLAARDGWQVEIATTCCLDEATWGNVLPAGEVVEDGLVVRRFPVERPSWLSSAASRQILRRSFLRRPLDRCGWRPPKPRSVALRDFLRATRHHWDAVVAGACVHGTTIDTIETAAARLLLVPCLHDEPEAWLATTGRMLRAAARLCFNTEPERDLARRLHGATLDGDVVGIGVDPPSAVAAVDSVRAAYGLRGDYLCFVGRSAPGKGVERLVAAVEAHNRSRPEAAVTLVLAGKGSPRGGDAACVRRIGFVDERTKHGLLAGALASVSFSRMESLSIVLLESWLAGTPAIVPADASVLAAQVRRSGGGIVVASEDEFAAAVELVRRPAERRRLAEAGIRLVRAEYTWDAAMERFIMCLLSIS